MKFLCVDKNIEYERAEKEWVLRFLPFTSIINDVEIKFNILNYKRVSKS